MGERRKWGEGVSLVWARRTLFMVVCAGLTSACPPDSASSGAPEEQGSKENVKSGAGNDNRSLQDISGAERGEKDSRDNDRDTDREPGGH
jgi:hypothetical protein